MTLQQLKYVVEIDRRGGFAAAAEVLGVTQPTLSGMVCKLEDELGVRIFDRTSRRVVTTALGHEIVAQARRVLAEAGRIGEMVAEARGQVAGEFRLAVGPSIAPYILPGFIRIFLDDCPSVELSAQEMRPSAMIDALREAAIDAGIAAAGLGGGGVWEIPLYTERFYVYLSADCMRRRPVFNPAELEGEHLWVMKEVQCLRESAFSFCKARGAGRQVYEAGTVDTLVRIVDANGGYTIIPEMHLGQLDDRQRQNVRPIDGEHLSMRRVSMYVRDDCVRQALLNAVVAVFKQILPAGMIDPALARRGIRL